MQALRAPFMIRTFTALLPLLAMACEELPPTGDAAVPDAQVLPDGGSWWPDGQVGDGGYIPSDASQPNDATAPDAAAPDAELDTGVVDPLDAASEEDASPDAAAEDAAVAEDAAIDAAADAAVEPCTSDVCCLAHRPRTDDVPCQQQACFARGQAHSWSGFVFGAEDYCTSGVLRGSDLGGYVSLQTTEGTRCQDMTSAQLRAAVRTVSVGTYVWDARTWTSMLVAIEGSPSLIQDLRVVNNRLYLTVKGQITRSQYAGAERPECRQGPRPLGPTGPCFCTYAGAGPEATISLDIALYSP